jgi:hypothetical protein
MNRRLANEAIFEIAMNDLRSESIRSVPIRVQKTLEQAFADAENAKRLFQSAFSRKGGRTRRTDALQGLILEFVRQNPKIAEKELLIKLKTQVGEGTISSIDFECDSLADEVGKIHFMDIDEKPKTGSLNGLKDRLGRAKKTFALTG